MNYSLPGSWPFIYHTLMSFLTCRQNPRATFLCTHISLLVPSRKQLHGLHICFSMTATLTNCMSEEKGENAFAKHREGKEKASATSTGNELCEPEGFPQAVGQESWAQQSLSSAWGWLRAGNTSEYPMAILVLHETLCELKGWGSTASRGEPSTAACYSTKRKMLQKKPFPLFVPGVINGLLLWMLYRGAQQCWDTVFVWDTIQSLNSDSGGGQC